MIQEKLSGILTLVAGLILVTRFCDAFFDCGCTWPWAGLEEFCNIHDRAVLHPCPWCASMLVGGISLGLALFLGYQMSKSSFAQKINALRAGAIDGKNASLDFLINSIFGIAVFCVAALVAGWFSAALFSYPDFLR